MSERDERGKTPTYYTVAPCGCVKTLMVDTPDLARHNAKEIAKAIRCGETLQRCTVADVWSGAVALGWCEVCDPKRAKKATKRAPQETQGALL